MNTLLEVSLSPHIRDEESVNNIMWSVVLALMPVYLASIIFFKWYAVGSVVVSVTVCLVTEYIIRRMRKRDTTITDGSAVITGMLLSFVLPPSLPLWMVALGAFLSIFLVKELFGGLGMNIFNPALAGRAILMAAFPQQMTTWHTPQGLIDGVTTATPLALVKMGQLSELPSRMELFLGNIGGCLGETSALAILIGGLFLLIRKIIRIEVPLLYIGGVYLLSWACGRDPMVEILAGGVMIGGIFMITDMVTTPVTRKGMMLFALGCAVITVAIRNWGGYPEGVCYSILIMNCFTPLIDRFIIPRRLGAARTR